MVHEDDALRAMRAAAEMRQPLVWQRSSGRASLRLDFGSGSAPAKSSPAATLPGARYRRAADVSCGSATRRARSRSMLTRRPTGSCESRRRGSRGRRWRLFDVADGRGAREPVRLADGRARARAAAAAGRVRAGGRRPFLPALHRARPRGCREVAARQEFLEELGGERARRTRALPSLRRGDHVLAAARGRQGGRRARRRRLGRRGSAKLAEPSKGSRAASSSPSAWRDDRARRGAGGAEEGSRPCASSSRCSRGRQPLVIVFDDIHWGEPTFLDLVEHLADWARDAPILLVCLARPELLERAPGLGRRQAERDLGAPRAALRGRMRGS